MKKAQPWFDEPFEKAMILLSQIVEVLDLPQFAAFREPSC